MPRPNRTTFADLDRPYAEIGERIKQFRLSKNLDQTDFADGGVNNVGMSRYETGLRAPSVKFLTYIREKHGADLNWIICGE